ncbi:purine nucleoside permease [Halioxenophilus sp. WMMB6]|uniref:purine-nucleoside phosphorylase n=1 Tax=Halioxenophilus sp. WMMB6 TaxID=3073815 RepID=UPI00295E29BB|nr:purine nucleoside permease [Halioxenophilus sp. WMMB6]
MVWIVIGCGWADGAVAEAVAPIKVKVLIAAMFEIGDNSGDRAGEFQYWYQRYFSQAESYSVKGAAGPLFCNSRGVCGSVLGMGKVASSASMLAILLDPRFDFSESFFIVSGVAGIPPSRGTIGDVSWATDLVDYDLGHRWSPAEGPRDKPAFMPRKGYEKIRHYTLNRQLLERATALTAKLPLQNSEAAERYRQRYPQASARRAPAVITGTHMTGDTFFHGPGLSAEAQYLTELYGAAPYVITEMEAAAIAQVLARTVGVSRLLSLRGAVNFDQGNPNETTLAHLDPAPGQTAGGFDETLQNIVLVGGAVVDDMLGHWSSWQAVGREP